jgi:hypothetical protein
MAALHSRGSALTLDRLILAPDEAGAHYFQIVTTDDELRFQRFVRTGRPPMDANLRFVGDRGDDGNVDTFMVLSDPTLRASAGGGVPERTITLTKPIRALDDLTVCGTLHVPDGIEFIGGNVRIEANARIVGAPLVCIEGGLRVDGTLHVASGTFAIGAIALSEDAANAALRIASNVHIAGDELRVGANGAGLRTRTLPGGAGEALELVAEHAARVSVGPTVVAMACAANVDVGTGGAEIRFEQAPPPNGTRARLGFYANNQLTSTVDAPGDGRLIITSHRAPPPTPPTPTYFANFTGAYLCAPETSALLHEANVGLVVESTGMHRNIGDVPIGPVDAVPVVRLASAASRCVLGVIAAIEPLVGSTRTFVSGALSIVGPREAGDRRIVVASMGEGAMWVIAENGAIETGDYIECSTVAGVGRRAAGATMTNRVVAKATGPCTFAPDDRVAVYTDMVVDGVVIVDAAGATVRVPALDANGDPVTRPRYTTRAIGAWIGAYIGVTFHCG